MTRENPKIKITKRNAKYLVELQDYDYVIEEKLDPNTGKEAATFVCKYEGNCNQEFLRSWNLLDHIRMHYNIRPYECQYCNFKFTQKGNLNKHMLKHLVPNVKDRKKFKCEECNKSYTKRSNYMVS